MSSDTTTPTQRSMETPDILMDTNTGGESESSQQDSLASPGQMQDSKRVPTIPATSGPRCLEFFARFPLSGEFSKMFSALLLGMGEWSSSRCKLIWKVRATPFNRLYFQLAVRTLRTKEIESGSSPIETYPEWMKQLPNESNKAYWERQAIETVKHGYVPTGPLFPTPHSGLGMGGMRQAPTTSITGMTPDGQKRQISLEDYSHRGLLPTPVVMDSGATTSLDKLDARRAKAKETSSAGNGFGETLGELAQRMMLPTPQCFDATAGMLKGKEYSGQTAHAEKLEQAIHRKMLPTPDATLGTGGKLTSLTSVSDTGMTADGKKRQISLPDAIRRAMLPTPRASEWKGVGPLGSKSQEDMLESGYLGAVIQEQTGQSGRLSPLFVASMMGLPIEYLLLPFMETSASEVSSGPSDTQDGATNP